MKKGEYHINGNDTRSFCYIDDAVLLTDELVKNVSCKILNVGRQEELSIEGVAKCVMDVMGIDPTLLEIRDGPKGSATRRCPDTSQLMALTKFRNYTTIQEGIKKTVESLA